MSDAPIDVRCRPRNLDELLYVLDHATGLLPTAARAWEAAIGIEACEHGQELLKAAPLLEQASVVMRRAIEGASHLSIRRSPGQAPLSNELSAPPRPESSDDDGDADKQNAQSAPAGASKPAAPPKEPEASKPQ